MWYRDAKNSGIFNSMTPGIRSHFFTIIVILLGIFFNMLSKSIKIFEKIEKYIDGSVSAEMKKKNQQNLRISL